MPEVVIVRAKADLSFTTVNFALRKKVNDKSKRFIRGYAEFKLFHDLLIKQFPKILIPSIPSPPVEDFIKHADHIEKKKRRMNTFLARLQKNPSLVESTIWKEFSNPKNPEFVDQSEKEPVNIGTGIGWFKKMVKAVSPGRVAKQDGLFPNPQIDNITDNDSFQDVCRVTLRLQSEYFTIIQGLGEEIASRKDMRKSLENVGAQLFSLSRSLEYPTINELIGFFGQMYTSLAELEQSQTELSVLYLGDPFVQIGQDCENLKELINYRTDVIIRCEEAKNKEQKLTEESKKITADSNQRMKNKFDLDGAITTHKGLITEKAEASEAMTNGMKLLNHDRTRMLMHNTRLFVDQQVEIEKNRLNILEKLLQELEPVP